MATLLAEGGDIHDYEIIFEPPDKITVPPTPSPKLPILSVPTTMGCAEFGSGGGGITDHHLGRKLILGGRRRDAPHGHHRRAGLGHDAAADPRFHSHRTAAHRH